MERIKKYFYSSINKYIKQSGRVARNIQTHVRGSEQHHSIWIKLFNMIKNSHKAGSMYKEHYEINSRLYLYKYGTTLVYKVKLNCGTYSQYIWMEASAARVDADASMNKADDVRGSSVQK